NARGLEHRAAWETRAGLRAERAPIGRGAVDRSAHVGASIWQTPGGVQSELERINSDFVVFAHEFEAFLKNRGYPGKVEPALRPLVELFEGVWTPLLHGWEGFFEKNKGWWDNVWWNHAPEAEQYQAQLVEVRAHAKELGMNTMSPTPARFGPSLLFDPQRNVFDRVADGTDHALSDMWSVVKVALYAGVAIAGGYAILTLAKHAKDPGAPR